MDLNILRHSAAHIMASAVKEIFPEAKLGIGPAIENGFYYDFLLPRPLTSEDLEKIEKHMHKIIKENYPFSQEYWSKEKAKDFFAKEKESFKLELIEGIEEDKVSIYIHNDFIDLCKGPHLASTGEVKFFKLLSTSGAYWRGDEKAPQLTRIYGTAFLTQKELNNYLNYLEEAKKRDHRHLGRQLELFDIYYDEAGAGLVFYLPEGATLRRIIENWEIKEHKKRGYQLVYTPHIMDERLWERSGHLDYYRDYIYPVNKENQQFILKPMNCPGHILIYKSKLRSWRHLPLRLFELGTVYRYEKSGVLHGLLRVRGFTQDDAHIFCRKEDTYYEIKNILDFIVEALGKFGFTNFQAELSTRPEKFIGQPQVWEKAQSELKKVLETKNIPYTIHQGEGAFYGPKIDILLEDVLKRKWQCATVQLDFFIPQRFNLTYTDKDGSNKQVIMIHRVILGSLERFIATLIEHYGGKFPFWLAPVQVSIISIGEDIYKYALQIRDALEEQGFRTEIDTSAGSLTKRVRNKELLRRPYIVILGKKEKDTQSLSVRKSGRQNLGNLSLYDLINLLKKEAI